MFLIGGESYWEINRVFWLKIFDISMPVTDLSYGLR